MKKIFTLILSGLTVLYTSAQITVDNTQTIEHYIQNILIGNRISASNITYNGGSANVQSEQVGEFSGPAVGINSGIILATGDATLAALPNTDDGLHLGGENNSTPSTDPDLISISNHPSMYDFVIVEFDFVPIGDTISFNYVFASEEYPEYVCSEYNDVFGFFLSGPRPQGGNYTSHNMARIPNHNNPNLFTQTQVGINTVNPGLVGAYGIQDTCENLDPNWEQNAIFYIDNIGTDYEYDGRTVKLTAQALVKCGESYHFKLAIGDAGDAWYDSGVFLESGSFTSSPSLVAQADNPGDVAMCSSNYQIDFDNGANNPPHNYWDFGDGTNSIDSDPSHIYPDTGLYHVMYIAIDSTTCNIRDTAHLQAHLFIAEDLTASITSDPADPCEDSLHFSAVFTGTAADSIYWDLGDGNNSNDFSINHYFTVPGQYIVSMEAYDFVCDVDTTVIDTINFLPTYSYTTATAPSDTLLCFPPFNVIFEASSPVPDHLWILDDGNTSTQATFTHTYADTGIYNVTYIAIDSTTCNVSDTATFTVDLQQTEQFLANFNLPTYDPCDTTGMEVNLTFTGTGTDSISWIMGDGTIYNDINTVNHTYSDSGSYNIQMIASDQFCNYVDTISEIALYQYEYLETEVIAPMDLSMCGQPYLVTFEATGIAPNYHWNLGDGNSSTLDTLTHEYTSPGVYNVTYFQIDSNTCNVVDSSEFSVTIYQEELLSVDFNIPSIEPCDDSTQLEVLVDFDGSGADSLMYDMGNGDIFYNQDSVNYTYLHQGTYLLTVYAADTNCNSDTSITVPINFNNSYTETSAMAPQDVTLCSAPYAVQFNATGDADMYYWDFGDGGNSSQDSTSHEYLAPGTYTVSYAQIDSTTCNLGDTVEFTVQVNQAELLTVDFDIPTPEPCADSTQMEVAISFTGSGADTLCYDMGDDSVYFNINNVLHTYYGQGSYILSVYAADTTCYSDTTIQIPIDFYTPYTETQAIPPIDVELCSQPYEINFEATAQADSYMWNFGDGTFSMIDTISHSYTYPGIYNVQYIQFDSLSCNKSDTANFTVTIVQSEQFVAEIDFTPPPVCADDSLLVELAFTGTGADSIQWNMGNGIIFNDSIISYYYTEAGVYNVSLSAWDFVCNHSEVIENEVIYHGNMPDSTHIPNVFTPNGDGHNDQLTFANLDATGQFKITIWNRWVMNYSNQKTQKFHGMEIT